ncbi:MAG: S-adenosylmethionine:tRNA ribosyltransferase-isomerase [Bacteroidota bacterium]
MNPGLEHIRLSDYHYDLPEERIAHFPLEERDQSRLLVYEKGTIVHRHFWQMPEALPADSLLVFNNTRVIRARLFFRRKTGALIEILLLHPIEPVEIHQAMQAPQSCVWECMIGNKKKWKPDEILEHELSLPGGTLHLQASWADRDAQQVRLSWSGVKLTFAEWLEALGNLPLPPYLNRDATEKDQQQYQTVYAEVSGAVAAPTAGLHFTKQVLDELQRKGVETEAVTLHVGAGTFLPVKAEQVIEHDMHSEQMQITRTTVEKLLRKVDQIVVVGTTSMRVVESIYWLGVQLGKEPASLQPDERFFVRKLDPYQYPAEQLPTPTEALQHLLDWMDRHQLETLWGETAIMILPSYPFALVRGLITNFHMPATTLILLVAAFIGEDWRTVYAAALEEDYRFLSYGDSSLLWRKEGEA